MYICTSYDCPWSNLCCFRIPLCTSFSFSSIVRCSDTSFPIQHDLVDDDNNPLGPRSVLYENFIQGCREYYGKKAHACDETERDRLAMSLRQPQSMQNYTDTGFKKIRAPEPLRKLLTEYWETNKDKKKGEQWSTGNTYTNHWAAPTYMVSVEDQGLRGGGSHPRRSSGRRPGPPSKNGLEMNWSPPACTEFACIPKARFFLLTSTACP